MSDRTPAENDAAREVILARVREALRVPAPAAHRGASAATSHAGPASHASQSPLAILSAEAARPWLPDGGNSPEESLRILAENLEKLRAVFVCVADLAAAATWLADEARTRGWQRVAWHADPLVERLIADFPVATHQVDADAEPFDKTTLETCDAGITACECLVAQTGSILVSSAGGGGRALSILPHCHVVIATADHVVPMLADALSLVRERHAGKLPSMLSFISGPSRTGDIERILVLGAHGPKELLVILVG